MLNLLATTLPDHRAEISAMVDRASTLFDRVVGLTEGKPGDA
jgi:hypothetical protein